jgi:hypothetical protein
VSHPDLSRQDLSHRYASRKVCGGALNNW